MERTGYKALHVSIGLENMAVKVHSKSCGDEESNTFALLFLDKA